MGLIHLNTVFPVPNVGTIALAAFAVLQSFTAVSPVHPVVQLHLLYLL